MRSELLVRVLVRSEIVREPEACMRLSRTVMFGSLRYQNSENFVSLTFSFFSMLD